MYGNSNVFRFQASKVTTLIVKKDLGKSQNQVLIYLYKQGIVYKYIFFRIQEGTTVLPPNSRFLGPGIFREFEIRELIIYDFPPNSL